MIRIPVKQKNFLGPCFPVRMLLPAAVILLFGLLSAKTALSISIPLIVMFSGTVVVLLALAQHLESIGRLRFSAFEILGCALVLRLMFIWDPPVLSDDLYRYLFDGFSLVSGVNPYTLTPASTVIRTGPMADIIPLVNHPHLVSLYPPMAQIVFAAGALLGKAVGPVAGMKLLFSIMDMISCVLILILLRRLKIPDSRLMLYAWNPLPILEVAWSGHVDAAALCFLLAAVLLAATSKGSHLSGSLLAAAVFTKLMPLMFFPAWFFLVLPENKKAALTGFLASGLLLAALFWPEVQNGMGTLATYLEHWEFSGFLFRSLRQVSGSGILSRGMLLVVFIVIVGIRSAYQSRYPGDLSRAMGGLSVAAGAYLVLAPTVYPWYALYLSALVPFLSCGRGPGLVWTWSLLLSYRILILKSLTGQWVEDSLTPLWILSAPAAFWLAMGLIRLRCRLSVHRPD